MNDQHMLAWSIFGRRTSRQALSRLDRRIYALMGGLLLLVAVACMLYLSQASTVTALRYQLANAQHEQDRLAEQIALARTDLAKADRQEVLEAHAKRLGLVDAPLSGPYVVCYVPAETPVAQASVASRQALQP